MKTSENGINLIKGFEAFRSEPYQDSVGVWTIGYGHTIGVTKDTPPKTMEEATTDLQDDLMMAEGVINEYVTVPLSQNQFDALASFTFNLGTGSLHKSTLLKKLNVGDYAGAADEFGKWVYAGGKVLNGLVIRRAKEKELFLS